MSVMSSSILIGQTTFKQFRSQLRLEKSHLLYCLQYILEVLPMVARTLLASIALYMPILTSSQAPMVASFHKIDVVITKHFYEMDIYASKCLSPQKSYASGHWKSSPMICDHLLLYQGAWEVIR